MGSRGWGGMGLPGHDRATECDMRRLATALPSNNHLQSAILAKLGRPLWAVALARLVSLLLPSSAACNGTQIMGCQWMASTAVPTSARYLHSDLVHRLIANIGGLRACTRNKPHICSGQRRQQERRRMA